MTVITIDEKGHQFEEDIFNITYYPLHVADVDTHRPFSHRYSVFEQLRYTEAVEIIKLKMK